MTRTTRARGASRASPCILAAPAFTCAAGRRRAEAPVAEYGSLPSSLARSEHGIAGARRSARSCSDRRSRAVRQDEWFVGQNTFVEKAEGAQARQPTRANGAARPVRHPFGMVERLVG